MAMRTVSVAWESATTVSAFVQDLGILSSKSGPGRGVLATEISFEAATCTECVPTGLRGIALNTIKTPRILLHLSVPEPGHINRLTHQPRTSNPFPIARQRLKALKVYYCSPFRGRIRSVAICDSDMTFLAQEAWTAMSGTRSLYLLAGVPSHSQSVYRVSDSARLEETLRPQVHFEDLTLPCGSPAGVMAGVR